jgi:eukaryotic-like serine/threonine-protein kinase
MFRGAIIQPQMARSPGTHVGPYEILFAIGAGGMGEVYRARDAKLGRDVAIKILPDVFAHNSERMARFQREAKVLASLSHTNIASIYGLEDSSTTHALVMELIEGPTLADRIKQGPIPISEALPIAKQMCEALEYAHERGIVHRDLKPANVKVTADDAVKVLDFGLAKALEGDPSSIDIATSPTISRMATQAGVLLGTAAYMSPEQAKAKPVDRRADIWAFGCVFYEMLTGKMAFHGETVTDTLAAIIKEEPDWSKLQAATPVRVRVLLQRCLQKDPKQRLRDIGDARISLDEVLSGAPNPSLAGATAIPAPLWRRALPWTLLGVTAVALAALAFVHFRERPFPPVAPVRFQIPLPETITTSGAGSFVLSPDGRQLGFAGIGADGIQRIWIRELDSLEARPLPGSESRGSSPFFWSPDSRFIAFDSGGKLKKMAISGGAAETICDLNGITAGGSWSRDGVIIFAQIPGGVMQVSASGGSPSPLTALNRSRGEVVHVEPSFLPDGRHFVYLRRSTVPENNGVYIGSLDARPEAQSSKRLIATQFGPAFAPSGDDGSGQLLFVRDGALMAEPFDGRRMESSGEPTTVAEQVGTYIGLGFFSVAANGALVYRTGGPSGDQPTWFDGQGKVLGTTGPPGAYLALALSPDGTTAALSLIAAPDPNRDIWLLDVASGTNTRFTFGPDANQNAVWSPDAKRIAFASNRDGAFNLYQKLTSGAKDEELLLKSPEDKYPTSWSRDGRFLLYTAVDPKTKEAIWVLPLEGDQKPFPLLRAEFNEEGGQFSPDGRWIAYSSQESGREEVYVRPFSPSLPPAAQGQGGKWQVSASGGYQPRWSRNGKELYYCALDGKLMAVEVTTDPAFRAEAPRVVFQGLSQGSITTLYSWWDLTQDSKRFLFLAPPALTVRTPFTVVLNWQAGLKK